MADVPVELKKIQGAIGEPGMRALADPYGMARSDLPCRCREGRTRLRPLVRVPAGSVAVDINPTFETWDAKTIRTKLREANAPAAIVQSPAEHLVGQVKTYVGTLLVSFKWPDLMWRDPAPLKPVLCCPRHARFFKPEEGKS